MLWIAFKIVSLTYGNQHGANGGEFAISCELLSKLYLWRMEISVSAVLTPLLVVVNCFQNCIFDVWKSAVIITRVTKLRLWIAFKIVSLTYGNQLHFDSLLDSFCCELLSKLYLWRMEISFHSFSSEQIAVVNCFQNCIFDVWKSADIIIVNIRATLWIAFKIVSLTYGNQHIDCTLESCVSCELLSKLYLWRMEISALC